MHIHWVCVCNGQHFRSAYRTFRRISSRCRSSVDRKLCASRRGCRSLFRRSSRSASCRPSRRSYRTTPSTDSEPPGRPPTPRSGPRSCTSSRRTGPVHLPDRHNTRSTPSPRYTRTAGEERRRRLTAKRPGTSVLAAAEVEIKAAGRRIDTGPYVVDRQLLTSRWT